MTFAESILKPVRSLRRECAARISRHLLANALRKLPDAAPKRIVIGSSGTRYPGWVPTEQKSLDLLDPDTWSRYFAPDELDAILAEHVWEHLTLAEAGLSARTCFTFLKPGAYLRIAVPDGCHPNAAYIADVRPGGTGSGALDHRVLYTFKTISDVLTQAGFSVRLYEYFDTTGTFHFEEWDPADGMIVRSKRYDERNAVKPLSYTSIVLDAIKP